MRIGVPLDLPDADTDRAWLCETLTEVATLTRTHLPRKARAYPSEALADEVMGLRSALLDATGE
ncbi:hypothetical protein [Kutzneria sp. 744]|uniref:hypothetical protein n=1 Tax=Kutzneria sp. (strain 744) TaxID=345341 RepID=UPI0005BE44F4|nr:hypothetical protein [Kutzneria sp. 744]